MEIRRDIWSLPFATESRTSGGHCSGSHRVPTKREHTPSLSRDGRYIAFASAQTGRMNIWLRELATGKESRVSGSSFFQRFPVVNASGSRVAFSVYEKDKRSVHLAAPGGAPEKLCEACLRATDSVT